MLHGLFMVSFIIHFFQIDSALVLWDSALVL